jgi:Family of unknown function (DUF6519)
VSFDNSRITFDSWKDYIGPVVEQGRVQSDADWNEWLAELSRRIQAGTLDAMGHAVYPATTPYAFQIAAGNAEGTNTINIGVGRMYVDGIVVENHGDRKTAVWDPALDELSNSPQPPPVPVGELGSSNSISYDNQPYNPGATVPQGNGEYLVYLDVWKRPITYIEDPSLVDVAIGVDTTGRIQTAWQVSVYPLPTASASAYFTITGNVTSGPVAISFVANEQVKQSGGASANLIGTVTGVGPMYLGAIAGSADPAQPWVGQTSGAVFTPNAAPAAISAFTIAGSVTSGEFCANEEVVQSNSLARANLIECVPGAGPMYVGSVTGPAADATDTWVGQTSGAVFTPSAVPVATSASTVTGSVTSSLFIANEEIVQSNSDASANLIGPVDGSGPMYIWNLEGTADGTDTWVGQTSGAVFAPSAAPVVSTWSCATPDSAIPWPVSSGYLTNDTVSSGPSGPCCLTAGTGYTGVENRFYRVEIHAPGTVGGVNATFKWSRENASVQTGVTGIAPGANSLRNPSSVLTVLSLGRDQVLGFSAGNWIEITNETLDDNCLPGELYQIDSVTPSSNTITLTTSLSSNFPASSLQANKYTRIIRWDSNGAIPVPTDGASVPLENGIVVEFGLSVATGVYRPMNYWNFAARTADGKIDRLYKAPPRGIYHHYSKLSIVNFAVTPPTATNCRTQWECSDTCGCGCCACTVGDGSDSIGMYSSIQQAIQSLPKNGGEVCILPGKYFENVVLQGLKNVVIKGCGPRSHVYSQSLQPGGSGSASTADSGVTKSGIPAVFTLVNCENVELRSFSASAATKEIGILLDYPPTAQFFDELLIANTAIAIEDLKITASTLPAMVARGVSQLRVAENRIAMKEVESLYAAVYLSGEEMFFERNSVHVKRETLAHEGGGGAPPNKPTRTFHVDEHLKAQTPPPGAGTESAAGDFGTVEEFAMGAPGGIQIAGPSKNVFVLENEIEGGSRNGITLGNFIIIDKNGGDSGTLSGSQQLSEGACSTGGTGTLTGSTGSGTTVIKIGAGGKIRNLHIDRNRILNMGMCGIGPVGYFDLFTTLEIVSLENVNITSNVICRTLMRSMQPFESKRSKFGYGAISLPDVVNLIIRDNTITDFGVTPGAEVCGIFVLSGEGIEISRNQIRETRDLNERLVPVQTSSGGMRAGIYISAVTPAALSLSGDSRQRLAESKLNVDINTYAPYADPTVAPGFPALRIQENVVRVALGLALRAYGTGPFSIVNNHFSSGGTVEVSSEITPALNLNNPDPGASGNFAAALTVAILNMGIPLEAFTFVESFLAILEAEDPDLDEDTNNLAISSCGTVLFTNNICQLEAQQSGVQGSCSVGIVTLDHILFANNELWFDAPPLSEVQPWTAITDALLIGVTVHAGTNRLQEAPGYPVFYSGITVGGFNITAHNISTYCIIARASSNVRLVDCPNLVVKKKLCPKSDSRAKT